MCILVITYSILILIQRKLQDCNMTCYHDVKETLATDREPTEAELKVVRVKLDDCVAACANQFIMKLPDLDTDLRNSLGKI